MNRRHFLAALATALVLPEAPRVRVYSFMPGEPEIDPYDMAARQIVEIASAHMNAAITMRIRPPWLRGAEPTRTLSDFTVLRTWGDAT